MHNKPLPPNHLRVSIDVVDEDVAALPVPLEDFDLHIVGDALGTFVAWPIYLIQVNSKVYMSLTFYLYIYYLFVIKLCFINVNF